MKMQMSTTMGSPQKKGKKKKIESICSIYDFIMKMQMAMTMGSPPKKGNKKNQFFPIFDFTMKMQMAMTMGSQGVF